MRKTSKIDKGQPTLFDFGSDILSEEEKEQINQILEPQIQHISHENHIKDSKLIKYKTVENSDEEPNQPNQPTLRSEQIIISKDNYPTISDSDSKESIYRSIDNISGYNHSSKNIYNQCLFEIRQSFFNKIDLNLNSINPDKERQLRIDIRSNLNKYKNYPFEKLKKSNYKNAVYKLLDKYFKEQSKNRTLESKENDNYSWSPQAAQQIIDMSVEAWLDNDLASRDYKEHPEHRSDYTGEPGLCNYRKSNEYISVFTNQQCNIDTKDVLITESMNEVRLRYKRKNFITFPDHLNIKPIESRLIQETTDLREVRIIPLIRKGYYKVELVYKKVIDKIKIKLLNLDPNRIIGIDTGQENIVTIANNIGESPIIIKGGVILAENQWFDKRGSELYSVYYRQQRHKGKESKGKKTEMGSKFKNLSYNRTNFILDSLHKISRTIINYCISHRIGTIVWGRNPGWKQNINLGRRTNQKFTKIPHYLLFRLLKYKAEEIGIKVIDIEESHTSKCSFLDNEPIGHKEKGQYVGIRGKKYPKSLRKLGIPAPKDWLGRGLFRTAKGIIWNSDVNAAYNMIRKVFPDSFKLNGIGIADVVLHPKRLSVSDLLCGRIIS